MSIYDRDYYKDKDKENKPEKKSFLDKYKNYIMWIVITIIIALILIFSLI